MFSVGEGGEVARELICSRASSRADRAYKADISFFHPANKADNNIYIQGVPKKSGIHES